MAIARSTRTGRAGVPVVFDQGFSDGLPYPDNVFDRVFSSFMFHHVAGDQKVGMLREIRRVLAPGGRFELLDFAGRDVASNGLLARMMHSHHLLRDNSQQRILALMAEAGLVHAKQVSHDSLLVGHVVYYQAARQA